LWSLAVEEQFYLAWPACLWLMYRFKPYFGWLLILVIAISFGAAVLTVLTDVSAAFYAPYLRVWELALGALLAWKRPRVENWGHAFLLSACGLILIAFAVTNFSATQSYPGWRALVPTFGAAMFIAADARSGANKLMSSRPLVHIGLISYPLYLWHWPLLSFANIIEGGRSNFLTIWGCLALSYLLAWVTYCWIEMPIRSSKTSRVNVVLLVLTLAGVAGLGELLHLQQGFPQRIPPIVAQQENRLGDWHFPPPEMQAVTLEGISVQKVGGNGPFTLFFGDSNTEQYGVRIAERLAGNSSNQRGAVFLTKGFQVPIDGVERSDNQSYTDTKNFMQLALSPIEESKPAP
jgi:hypothetical protein